MTSLMGIILLLALDNTLCLGFDKHNIDFPISHDFPIQCTDELQGVPSEKNIYAASETNIDIVASDGVKLKAMYYSPGKPGPAILLLHQCNMNRKSWNSLATALVERGIHVLTFDYRGYGETPAVGGRDKLTTDIDVALSTLLSQAGVDALHIAAGGASCGVNNPVMLATRNDKTKALMLLSGPTSKEGLAYLRDHPGLAIFGAASSEEDFAVKAIGEMVAASTNPASIMKTLHNAGHGAPMFTADPTLLQSATEWMEKILK